MAIAPDTKTALVALNRFGFGARGGSSGSRACSYRSTRVPEGRATAAGRGEARGVHVADHKRRAASGSMLSRSKRRSNAVRRRNPPRRNPARQT